MAVVCHIAARAEWARALAAGAYRTGSLDTEGFIHGSTAEQVAATADRLFAGRRDLVLLFVDSDRLQAALRFEPVTDPPGAVFPHIFGPINLAAVFEVAALAPGADGRFDPDLAVTGFAAAGDRTVEQAEAQAMTAMAGCRAPWWVAGGWALDLHAAAAGRDRIRPHSDLEISILRRDQRTLFDHLAGWQTCAVIAPGVLEDWDGRTLPAGVHQIWARRGAPLPPRPDQLAADPALIDFLLEEADGDSWRFRRQAGIARPLAELGATSSRGVPFLRPEVALLYKAKQPRFKDQHDFDASAPTLDPAARAWLASALEQAHPGHPWRAALGPLPRG